MDDVINISVLMMWKTREIHSMEKSLKTYRKCIFRLLHREVMNTGCSSDFPHLSLRFSPRDDRSLAVPTRERGRNPLAYLSYFK